MTIFSLSCNPNKIEDNAAFNSIMEAWDGHRIMESTWILKRNDGCTCRDIIDDLLDHISPNNEIFVVEIAQKDSKPQMEKHLQSL